MPHRKVHIGCVVSIFFAFISSFEAAGQSIDRTTIDSSGRHVVIPKQISRVLAAGPPASVLLYTLAPQKMIGWVRAPTTAEKPFLLESVRELPEYGRITARGGPTNLNRVLESRPYLIIDVGEAYISLANDVQAQTQVPYLLFDGTLEKTPKIYRLLGDLLDVKDRAEALARYAESVLRNTALLRTEKQATRPRLYVARGPSGLETRRAGSMTLEVLEHVGASILTASEGNPQSVSPEQIASWDPHTVLALDSQFYISAQSDLRWRSIRGCSGAAHFFGAQIAFWLA